MVSAFHQLFYHLVWRTYKRIEMIDESIEKDLRQLLNEKVIEKQSELLCFGCTSDHVHLLVRIHPAVSISELIGEIKGYSSYMLSSYIHKDCGFRWQRGYGALTLSQRELPWIIKYVKNQKEHHRRNNLDKKMEITGV